MRREYAFSLALQSWRLAPGTARPPCHTKKHSSSSISSISSSCCCCSS